MDDREKFVWKNVFSPSTLLSIYLSEPPTKRFETLIARVSRDVASFETCVTRRQAHAVAIQREIQSYVRTGATTLLPNDLIPLSKRPTRRRSLANILCVPPSRSSTPSSSLLVLLLVASSWSSVILHRDSYRVGHLRARAPRRRARNFRLLSYVDAQLLRDFGTHAILFSKASFPRRHLVLPFFWNSSDHVYRLREGERESIEGSTSRGESAMARNRDKKKTKIDCIAKRLVRGNVNYVIVL